MDDWSYCMCCDVYIDFKNLEAELAAKAKQQGKKAETKPKEIPTEKEISTPAESARNSSICAQCVLF